MKNFVTQISIGRFHHFHLARQLERYGLLREIWTGYPYFKLKSETNIPQAKIRSFPWLQTPYMARGSLNIKFPMWLDREWEWLAHTTLDAHVARRLTSETTLIALSGGGLFSGLRAKETGGRYFCDRGSSHIRFQDQTLREEFSRWKLPFAGIDPRVIAREEAEYAAADSVSVPSTYAANSFIEMGVPPEKLFLNPYGARLERFAKICEPPANEFTILFVGQVGLRKGFLYLLQAFARLRHPNKRLKVIGGIQPELKSLLRTQPLEHVEFLGIIPNSDLPRHYSSAHVFALPSIEEGLAMVMGEALACGCPVIATTHAGAQDLFSDGKEGFIIPPRSVDDILARLEQLAQDAILRENMAQAALARVHAIGGWDAYGARWAKKLGYDAQNAS